MKKIAERDVGGCVVFRVEEKDGCAVNPLKTPLDEKGQDRRRCTAQEKCSSSMDEVGTCNALS